MKEAIVHPGTRVEIIDSEIPKPNANQVLIQIVFSGCNQKDWKRPEWFQTAHNCGDDISGIVEAVGASVTEFRPGDRVAALHEMMAPGGSYAEYGLAWDYATFHLPLNISFEEVSPLYCSSCESSLKIPPGCYNSPGRDDGRTWSLSTSRSAISLVACNRTHTTHNLRWCRSCGKLRDQTGSSI